MNEERMPEGLSRLDQIFWRVEVEDKENSPAMKEIVEKIKRERQD